jgi:hypothetical protein
MKKINVKIDQPRPTSEEILKGRNFDQVLSQYKAGSGGQVNGKWSTAMKLGVAAVGIAASVAVVVLLVNAGDEHREPQRATIPETRVPEDSIGNGVVASYTRSIQPPISGADVPFQTFKINGAKGGILKLKNGTTITVPARAFKDDNNTVIPGDVTIQYREMHDAADFLLSGIPMDYDSAGTTYTFASAGMMELNAFVDGKIVKIDEQKGLNIKMRSYKQGTAYNLYRYDTDVNNWVFLGKDKVEEKKLDDQSQQPTHGEDYPGSDVELQQQLSAVIIQNPVPEEPIEPKKADKTKNRFTVAFNDREFPEMASYKNVIFEVDETREKFDRAIYNKTWQTVVLKKGEEREKYVIVLTKGLEVVNLDVYPVFDEQNYVAAKKVFDEKFATYTTALNKRKEAERVAQENWQKAMQKQQAAITPTVIPQQSTQDAEIYRAFTINQTGIYNCDNPVNLPKGGQISVTFTNDNGVRIPNSYFSYLVDPELNATYKYYGNPFASFKFNPDSRNIIWLVADGTLYYAKEDQTRLLPLSGVVEVPLKKSEKAITNAEELRTMFNLQPLAAK